MERPLLATLTDMGDFEVVRSTTIAAPPERVHALIDDFHAWRQWSPWEELDPNMEREFSGAESGVGARYAWEGNRKAGKGNMEMVECTRERVALRLTFEKPWKATNRVAFELTPRGDATEVDWRMTGTNKGLMALFSRVFSMDRMVGKDFEKGLERLKARAEAGAAPSESEVAHAGDAGEAQASATAAPIDSANAIVPGPNVPPRITPIVSAVISMPVRIGATGRPVTRCSPVISPSRGPGPSAAPR